MKNLDQFLRFAEQHFASAAAQIPFDPIPMAAPVSMTLRGGVTRLQSRGVLRLSGTDLLPFLQSLLTNDVSQILSAPSSTSPTAAAARCQYTALLHSKGRLLHDLFLHVPHPAHGGGNGDGDGRVLLCDVEAARLGELVTRLRRYKLRADVDIADVSEEFAVLASDALPSTAQDDVTSDGSAEGSALYRDPRLPDLLPRRGIVHADCLLSVAGGQGETDDERGYVAARRAAGVAEGSEEMAIGEALPLEYNLDGLNAISFEKGCYIGQELTARTHFRGVVRKRVMPVRIMKASSEQHPAVGMELVSMRPKKKLAGTLVAMDTAGDGDGDEGGTVGLAHVRLALALQHQKPGSSDTLCTTTTGNLLHIMHGENNDVEVARVRPWRPSWWADSWGREEL